MRRFKEWIPGKTLTTDIIISAGIVLRILVASRGHNYDFESYLTLVKVLDHWGNVYAETTRYNYNYGPVWSYTIYGIYLSSLKNELIFRYIF